MQVISQLGGLWTSALQQQQQIMKEKNIYIFHERKKYKYTLNENYQTEA